MAIISSVTFLLRLCLGLADPSRQWGWTRRAPGWRVPWLWPVPASDCGALPAPPARSALCSGVLCTGVGAGGLPVLPRPFSTPSAASCRLSLRQLAHRRPRSLEPSRAPGGGRALPAPAQCRRTGQTPQALELVMKCALHTRSLTAKLSFFFFFKFVVVGWGGARRNTWRNGGGGEEGPGLRRGRQAPAPAHR